MNTKDRKTDLKNRIAENWKTIQNFDSEKDSPSKLNDAFKNLDEILVEIEDLISELEVEDFLENGPGIKNKNI